MDMHYKELKHTGESEMRMATLSAWKETSFFSEKERAVLSFTEAVTNISINEISDEFYEPLSNFYSKEEICILTLAIAQLNTWTRLMKTFRLKAGNHKVIH